MAPVAVYDQENNWALAHYIAAIGTMIHDIIDLSRAPSTWGDLMDPDTCPPEGLGWLAQLVGIRLPQPITASEARAIIKQQQNFKRGTPEGIAQGIEPLLTGTQFVSIIERADGNPYKIVVRTITSETPDPAAVTALLSKDGPDAIVPAGIIWTYTTTENIMLFGDLRQSPLTFGQTETNYANFGVLKVSPPPA